MATEDLWQGGAHVRVVGLVNAAQHNGKLGTLDKKTGDRWGVLLDERAFGDPRLAVKESNLELVEQRCFRTTAAVADFDEKKGWASFRIRGYVGIEPGQAAEDQRSTVRFTHLDGMEMFTVKAFKRMPEVRLNWEDPARAITCLEPVGIIATARDGSGVITMKDINAARSQQV